jgi:hypothetical protein
VAWWGSKDLVLDCISFLTPLVYSRGVQTGGVHPHMGCALKETLWIQMCSDNRNGILFSSVLSPRRPVVLFVCLIVTYCTICNRHISSANDICYSLLMRPSYVSCF